MSRKKVDVAFTAKDYEPPFVRQLREKHGLLGRDQRGGPGIAPASLSDKFEDKSKRKLDNSSIDVRDEEQPTVVVLKKGQLTREEAEQEIKRGARGAEGVLSAANAADQKAIDNANKPSASKTTSLQATTKKSSSSSSSKVSARERTGDESEGKPHKKAKVKKNTKLLSFNEEEDF